MTDLYSLPIRTAQGGERDLQEFRDTLLLIVNTASGCGLTPQLSELQQLVDEHDGRLAVVGFPSNQFGGQEPGTDAEIQEFCALNHGVTFPVFAKTDVNRADRHPLYELLTATPDSEGVAGDVAWNFEKFLVAPGGEAVARFRPTVSPLDESVRAEISARLAATEAAR